MFANTWNNDVHLPCDNCQKAESVAAATLANFSATHQS